MLLVIHRRRRVKWPSERSEWLLDAAAPPTQWKHTATPSGGCADNLLSSGKRSNGSLARGSVEGEGFPLDHPGRDLEVFATPPREKKDGLIA